MFYLPLTALNHRSLKNPVVVHQVWLFGGAEAAHLRWEGWGCGLRREVTRSFLRGAALAHTFLPLASSITHTSLHLMPHVTCA